MTSTADFSSQIPSERIRTLNAKPVQSDGDFVLYWMIAHRRPSWNYGLDRAVEWSRELGKPLVILEALRCGYQWNCDRLHAFVIEGMIANQKAFASHPVTYYPWLESKVDEGKGLLAALAEKAALVVTDDFPCTFLPAMTDAGARQVGCRMESIDGNGMIPMRLTDKVFARAVDFRRYLQKNIVPWLTRLPCASPFEGIDLPRLESLPDAVTSQWPPADLDAIADNDGLVTAAILSPFPINHDVAPAPDQGGYAAAEKHLNDFVTESRLGRYHEDRNQPQEDVPSGLSPWLHFGHLSVHQVFDAVTSYKPWDVEKISDKATASRTGWWGAAPEVESFLDELITWRELGYNMCAHRDDYDQYESLPDWAQETLAEHASDKREWLYDLEQFASGDTHDPLWNAAQNQLVQEGRIHNYLRMLWGKKILQWTESPQQALEFMIELNNRYALDGRNPNSYSGIFWVLGRYDRPWGPERPIFGKIRYMTSDNTARKVKVKDYIARYAHGEKQLFD